MSLEGRGRGEGYELGGSSLPVGTLVVAGPS